MKIKKGFPGGTSSEEPTCQCRKHKRCGFNPWSGRSPGGGHGNPLQYSCLENPLGRGAWQATVHEVAKESDTTEQLQQHYSWLYCLRESKCVIPSPNLPMLFADQVHSKPHGFVLHIAAPTNLSPLPLSSSPNLMYLIHCLQEVFSGYFGPWWSLPFLSSQHM